MTRAQRKHPAVRERASIATLSCFITLAMPAMLVTACSDSPFDPPATPAVWSVAVVPDTATLQPGQSRSLTATARAQDGTVLHGRAIAWSSDDTAVVVVDSAGVATARQPGQATLTASIGGKLAQATILVQASTPPPPAAVARIEIAPSGQIDIRSLSTRQLSVHAFAADGTELFGRPVTWSSSDATIARVDPGHVLKAGNTGMAAITASVEGRTAILIVQVLSQVVTLELVPTWMVLAPGEVTKIDAYARDESGALLNKVITWHSSNPGVANVGVSGRVTALALGTATITASVEGIASRLDVVVGNWTDRQLLTLNGSAPPVVLFEITLSDSLGTGTTTWIEARSGRLRLLDAGSARGRYEQRFAVAIRRDGQPVEYGELVFPGTYANDALGRLEFRTVNDEPLVVRRLGDGRIAVAGTGRATIGNQEVSSDITFIYAAP